jgi:hypothetical protein
MLNRKVMTAETIAQLKGVPGPRVYDDMVEILYQRRRLPAYCVAGRWETVIDTVSYDAFAHHEGDSHDTVRTSLAAWADSKPELFAHWK